MFLMTFGGAVILCDVVATLGGRVFATLGLGAATLGAGVPVRTLGACVPVCIIGSSGVCRPAKMVVKSCIALICLFFFVVIVGTATLSVVMSSAAVEMERSCCEDTGIWL
jgi:hypothetical protein